MSKTKQKQHSEIEHLRGQIKTLKSQNRHLQRRVRDLEKKKHMYESTIDTLADEGEAEIHLNACPACKKGIIEEIDFKYIILRRCPACRFQERRRPHEKEEADNS